MPRATLQEVLDALSALRRLYVAVGIRAAMASTETLNRIANRIVVVVGRTTAAEGEAVSADGLGRILREITAEIASIQRVHAAQYGRMWKDAEATVTRATPEAYAVFGPATTGKLMAARGSLARATRSRGAPYNAGFTQWVDGFRAAGEGLRSSMQRSLIQAQLNGWGQGELARSFLSSAEFAFKNLPPISARAERVFNLAGRLDAPEALMRRAHVIARTESTAVINRMHADWTSAAGFDLYVNINGVPVAEACIAANDEGPMTLEDWDDWGLANEWPGRPPRHPNCDSALVAVPEDYADEFQEREEKAEATG